MGNSFEEKYNSKIDTLNYSWRDSFQNNQLVLREYPKYQGAFKKKEIFEYYENGKLKAEVIETIYPSQKIISDTTQYIRKDANTTEVVKFNRGKKMRKSIQKISNDTMYIDHIIGGKYGFTSREFWETNTRKHDQIIKPKLSEVLNIYIHNQNGDLISIERHENGKLVRKTMTLNYKYDVNNRIIMKDIYYAKEEKMTLGSKELTIYE